MRPPGRDTFGGQAVRSVGRDCPGHHRAGAHSRGGQPRSRGPRYGVRGVRGEAEDGFPAVRELALPHLLSREGSGEERALKALLALISHLWDTNVLHRAGEEGLRWLRGQARAVLDDFSLPALRALDRECIRRNISPGGSADLLAIALFLRELEK